MTFRRSSDIHFVRSSESSVGKGLSYTLLTLIFGWWGIPWGPIYTIGSVFSNFRGGKDVTNEIISYFNEPAEEDVQEVEEVQ